jgi:hypothetical protein
MTILCSGCSFTIGSHKDENHKDIDYLHWPEFLPRSKNVAVGGAGNRRIARTILENIDDGIDKMEAVVVMWSTAERYDFYDAQFNAYKAEGSSYTGTKEHYLKYFYSDFNQFAKTLEYILLIQHMCKARSIPLINTHMGDLRYHDWDMDAAYGIDNVANRVVQPDSEIKDFFQKSSHPAETAFLKTLWQQINWDNWVFWNDNGGLWQMTNDKEYKWVAYHPPQEAHKYWAENIIIPKLRSLNVKIT